MIAQLTGTVASVRLTQLILDVNGVGYLLDIPMSTYDKLPPVGGRTTLLTLMLVREDAIQLYGFASKDELEVFKLLLTVKGVGAKIALSILSSMNIQTLCNAIIDKDIKVLKKISGVGPRSAERMVLELHDAVAKMFPEFTFVQHDAGSSPAHVQAMEDALLALESLGYQRVKIQKEVADITAALPEEQRSSENIIRQALRNLTR